MNARASIGLILALAVLVGFLHTKEKSDDLIGHPGWSQVAGLSALKSGVRVSARNRSLSHQDGSVAQPNPSVALMGPHLSVSGNFKVTAKMESVRKVASLRLYSKPPIVYDQWRYETPSVRVDVATSSVSVFVWDGSSSTPIDMRVFPYQLRGKVLLSISLKDNLLQISVNETLLGSMPDHTVFQSEEIWFGLEATEEDWILTSLKAEPLDGGAVEGIEPPSFLVPHTKSDALRNLASTRARPITIGTAVSIEPLVFDSAYRTLVFEQFNSITSENGFKPQFIHPQKEIYVFEEMNVLVNASLANEAVVHGHALVYAKSNPEWMDDTSKVEREAVMTEHIEKVVGHFKGRVAGWDVVNEPLSSKKAPYKDGGNGLEETIWYEAMGEEYIDTAFRAAHKADPQAVLYLNDYGLERDGERWDALVALLKRLKERGVPIHGVGFESHVYGDGDYSDLKVLLRHMKILADMGLLVRISEIDVTGDDEKEQINQYVLALDACLKSPNCTSYSTWGVTDRYGSTTRSDRYPLVFGTSLLWDTDMKAKPAVTSLQHRLRQ